MDNSNQVTESDAIALGYSRCCQYGAKLRVYMEKIIGLELGVEYCRAAVYLNNHIEIIPDKDGNLYTPSRIGITENGDVLVGNEIANAREVRNVFEQIKFNQANRVILFQNPSLKELQMITEEDVPNLI